MPGSSMEELLTKLVKRYQSRFKDAMFSSGQGTDTKCVVKSTHVEQVVITSKAALRHAPLHSRRLSKHAYAYAS
jgi:hypothetical protein